MGSGGLFTWESPILPYESLPAAPGTIKFFLFFPGFRLHSHNAPSAFDPRPQTFDSAANEAIPVIPVYDSYVSNPCRASDYKIPPQAVPPFCALCSTLMTHALLTAGG